MRGAALDTRMRRELQRAIDRVSVSGQVLSESRILQQIKTFEGAFGLNVLQRLNGKDLLKQLHGRDDPDFRCLAYWLEFKNDEEFFGHHFGRIGGGTALKFGLYQRQSDGAWVTGSAVSPRVLSLGEAVEIAELQREELLGGAQQMSRLNRADASDHTYAELQRAMSAVAPQLAGSAWAHKYWYLLFSDRLDDYHSPRYQRFHLLKLLEMPPDHTGLLDGNAPRFVCAGRYVTAARELGIPISTLSAALKERHGSPHRYWRVGTTAGGTGSSQWPHMRAGQFVSIGWPDELGDLTALVGWEPARAKGEIHRSLSKSIRDPRVASRKTGEVFNFCHVVAENDLVLACEGQEVLGVGRIRGPYEYQRRLDFPHVRPVEWLSLDRWRMPEPEGLQTTVCELGKKPDNILQLERRLFVYERQRRRMHVEYQSIDAPVTVLPPLDPFSSRLEGMLARKGQVVLYGPPGTGKTHRAFIAAGELAARTHFNKDLSSLTQSERDQLYGPDHYIRTCTFHPGYGYEDFIEGLRPRTSAREQLVFEPEDGIFKQICVAATKQPDQRFFLIIDEINRGDLPRIFGELMTALELDKRAHGVILPVTRKVLIIPPNLFLIGTMNTADRSISLMDTALRRRFAFAELMPDSSVLGSRAVDSLLLGPWLDALNARIRKHLKRDARNLQVGHSFLLPAQKVASAPDFARVLRDEIIPLVEEYCYDDFHALEGILGAELVDSSRQCIREELFEPQKEEELLAAVSFEEMQALALGKNLVSAEETAGSPDEGAENSDESAGN